MPSLTVENYLKAIYQISATQDGRAVSTGQLATALGVAPGTVTSMLKTLDAARLAAHRPYEGVALSETGRALALRVIRRHRLIEQFLVETLDMTWDEVHDEAEHMEHAVSDLLVDRIDAFLGRPEVDPHGDPIPDASGRMEDRTLAPLPAAEDGRYRIARVSDQDSHMLDWMQANGLTIGMEIHIARGDETAGILELYRSRGEEPVRVARASARGIYVEAL